MMFLALSVAAIGSVQPAHDPVLAAIFAAREQASSGSILGSDIVRRALRPASEPSVIASCFAPGTDVEYQAAFSAWIRENSGGEGLRFFNGGRWSVTATNGANTGTYGSPVTVTYSFPQDGLGGITGGTTSVNELNARFVQWFGSVAAGKALVRQCFDRWEAVSGIRYVEVADDNSAWGAGGSASRGDVRIASINIDGPSNVLAFNFFPDNGDMVIDSSEGYGAAGGNFIFFRNVVTHEAGHGWGAQHVCPTNQTKLMEPFYSGAYDGPQHDDIRGIQFAYGDRFESNNTPAAGSTVNLTNGVTNFSNLSLHRGINDPLLFPADEDFFRIVAPTGGTLSVTITPTGQTYQNGQQQPGGACGATTAVDSLRTLDLQLQVRGTNGVTVLASANAGGLGQPESIPSVVLPTGGAYFIRVFTATSTPDVQLYNLSLTWNASGCPGDANGDNIVDFRDLNLVLGNFGQTGPNVAGDVNRDGVVNFADLNLVLSNFGTQC